MSNNINSKSGLFKKGNSELLAEFNSSISVDSRMYEEDIDGSIVHAKMLGRQNIITQKDSERLVAGLVEIKSDIKSGRLQIDKSAEDIHMFIETELTARLGDVGKRLHTARSRNDQVATDLRLYLNKQIKLIINAAETLIKTLSDLSEKYKDTVMPGYTHLQRAQPVTFGDYLNAYSQMLTRDKLRLIQTGEWMMYACPLGSGALAGTTYFIDREFTARELGFEMPCENTLDGVSDRDFVLDLAFDISMIMTHLSRFSEEIIIWCSHEFKFITLDDAYATGSSIMPQKKNPDIPELVRGKTGRVNGNLVALLTMVKGLPLAYNKDMQEDKEAVFDSIDTVMICLRIFSEMLATMMVNEENMYNAAGTGFINATDCADYLTKKGMPFRDAYKVTGSIVAFCSENGFTLESMPFDKYKTFSDLFDTDIYDVVNLLNCVKLRRPKTTGGGFQLLID
jgi:argininosuccinate lyase